MSDLSLPICQPIRSHPSGLRSQCGMRQMLAAWALALAAAVGNAVAGEAEPGEFGGDPMQSFLWPDLRREFLGDASVVRFDETVRVRGPGHAEDPMNVPITVQIGATSGIDRVLVLVDRNPIRRVLEFWPLSTGSPLVALSFRFKLEQSSPVRALAHTADGVWHVTGTWVESAGGGCTVPGATRADGSWPLTLGQVSARLFTAVPGSDGAARLRMRVMHPMDTGLVSGIPAFFVSRLALRDASGNDLLRLQTYEPVSENPVFSFDFGTLPTGPLRIVGSDNNGNRIDSQVDP
jgi:sulfur-oxidizing protein SoxY